jgi:hypothetical protein
LADVFEEVEGQLRAERYRSLGRRLLPWLIGGAVLALAVSLAVYGWNQYRQGAAEQASVDYAAGLKALEANNPAEAERRFTAAAGRRSDSYRSLALMQRAGMRVADNKPREAVPLLDEAAKAAPAPLLADAAALKAAFLVMDYAPLNEIERRLEPLREEGRPYRNAAREAWAMAQVGAGRATAARREFVVLAQALDTSEGARARAQAMIAAIDSGAAAQVPAILRATPAAPATPVVPAQPQAVPVPAQ